jgi:cytidylate kinase
VGRSVVCISRALGAGGEEVGWLVAERLGFHYVDERVLASAASRAGVDIERIAEEEQRSAEPAGLLEPGGAVTAPPDPADDLSSEAVRELIRDAIQDISARGNAVIVAHAASFAVGRQPHALRVLVTAPDEIRAKRLRAVGGLSEEQAITAVRDSDRDRSDYLARFYGVDAELPTHYDLVLNTDTISFEDAADLVAHAAGGESLQYA